MRHGDAVGGSPDRERALSTFGQQQVYDHAKATLSELKFDTIVCSPYVRTVQTAQRVVDAIGWMGNVVQSDAIESGASLQSAMQFLTTIPDGVCWLVISHMPLVAQWTHALVSDPYPHSFKTATNAIIHFSHGVALEMGELQRINHYGK